ncbi:MAG: DUF6691 family protein [Saprospiraceae bacterium]
MKYLKFLLVGVLFGIIVTKSEIISWFRIQEMFRFDSFHMYGIIGTAVISGIIMVQIIKKYKIKSMEGTEITFQDKDKSFTRYIIGGTIFGLGWALVGACPGPMFAVLGVGVWSMGIVFVGALLGTFLYGVLRSKLPH